MSITITVQGRGRSEADFMWMWSRFQNQSQARLQAAAASSGLDTAPELILWSNHLTSEQYIHYLDPDTYTIQVR